MTVRELRGSITNVKGVVVAEGIVIVSAHGEPKYIRTLYSPPAKKAPAAEYYMDRPKTFRPLPPGAAAAKSLYDESRRDR